MYRSAFAPTDQTALSVAEVITRIRSFWPEGEEAKLPRDNDGVDFFAEFHPTIPG
jgi:hypothetical protein